MVTKSAVYYGRKSEQASESEGERESERERTPARWHTSREEKRINIDIQSEVGRSIARAQLSGFGLISIASNYKRGGEVSIYAKLANN